MDLFLKLLFTFVVVWPLLQTGHTRALSDTTADNKTKVNLTTIVENKSNATDLSKLENVKESAKVVSTSSIKHLRRKREMEVTMPFDLHTLHLPCDWEHRGLRHIIRHMPNHCIWVFNNKHTHEGFYRVFKTYHLESFFFYQYYERLKRYEIDIHDFDFE